MNAPVAFIVVFFLLCRLASDYMTLYVNHASARVVAAWQTNDSFLGKRSAIPIKKSCVILSSQSTPMSSTGGPSSSEEEDSAASSLKTLPIIFRSILGIGCDSNHSSTDRNRCLFSHRNVFCLIFGVSVVLLSPDLLLRKSRIYINHWTIELGNVICIRINVNSI